MLIVQISDSHIAVPAAPGSTRLDDLRNCIDHINAMAEQPDLVIHTGDVAHDGKATEYAEAARILEGLRTPLYVMPGNRDNRAALRKTFAGHLPDSCHIEFIQYAIAGQSLHIIALDTLSDKSGKGVLCATRLSHLKSMLKDASGVPVVIFMHHPPFDVTQAPEPLQFDNRANLDEFAALLTVHGNIKHICCGHNHRVASGHIAGIPASTIPCMAKDLRKGSPVTMSQVVQIHLLSAG